MWKLGVRSISNGDLINHLISNLFLNNLTHFLTPILAHQKPTTYNLDDFFWNFLICGFFVGDFFSCEKILYFSFILLMWKLAGTSISNGDLINHLISNLFLNNLTHFLTPILAHQNPTTYNLDDFFWNFSICGFVVWDFFSGDKILYFSFILLMWKLAVRSIPNGDLMNYLISNFFLNNLTHFLTPILAHQNPTTYNLDDFFRNFLICGFFVGDFFSGETILYFSFILLMWKLAGRSIPNGDLINYLISNFFLNNLTHFLTPILAQQNPTTYNLDDFFWNFLICGFLLESFFSDEKILYFSFILLMWKLAVRSIPNGDLINHLISNLFLNNLTHFLTPILAHQNPTTYNLDDFFWNFSICGFFVGDFFSGEKILYFSFMLLMWKLAGRSISNGDLINYLISNFFLNNLTHFLTPILAQQNPTTYNLDDFFWNFLICGFLLESFFADEKILYFSFILLMWKLAVRSIPNGDLINHLISNLFLNNLTHFLTPILAHQNPTTYNLDDFFWNFSICGFFVGDFFSGEKILYFSFILLMWKLGVRSISNGDLINHLISNLFLNNLTHFLTPILAHQNPTTYNLDDFFWNFSICGFVVWDFFSGEKILYFSFILLMWKLGVRSISNGDLINHLISNLFLNNLTHFLTPILAHQNPTTYNLDDFFWNFSICGFFVEDFFSGENILYFLFILLMWKLVVRSISNGDLINYLISTLFLNNLTHFLTIKTQQHIIWTTFFEIFRFAGFLLEIFFQARRFCIFRSYFSCGSLLLGQFRTGIWLTILSQIYFWIIWHTF